MLELSNLLIGAWAPVPGARSGHHGSPQLPVGRIIVDPATRTTVGVARQRPPSPSWKFWRPQAGFDVFETDDQPLLCSVRRLWAFGRFCDVRDAENHLVGRFDRGRVQDAYGWGWAAIQRDAAQRIVRFSDASQELAAVAPVADGDLLMFRAPVGENPFARMLLLAVSLAEGWSSWQLGAPGGGADLVSGRGGAGGVPSAP